MEKHPLTAEFSVAKGIFAGELGSPAARWVRFIGPLWIKTAFGLAGPREMLGAHSQESLMSQTPRNNSQSLSKWPRFKETKIPTATGTSTEVRVDGIVDISAGLFEPDQPDVEEAPSLRP